MMQCVEKMRAIFDWEAVASPKTQKKCLTKVVELAMSLPKGYFYSIKVNGSQDRRRRVNVGGTYFDLDFYVWDINGKKVLWRSFEDSDGTKDWDTLYYSAKKEIAELPEVEINNN